MAGGEPPLLCLAREGSHRLAAGRELLLHGPEELCSLAAFLAPGLNHRINLHAVANRGVSPSAGQRYRTRDTQRATSKVS